MKKICLQCNCSKNNVFNRTLNNEILLLCDKCYRKCLDICSLCRRHTITFTYSKENKPICKKCFTEPFRICRICKNKFPAGRGKICNKCSYFHSLSKKISILNLILSEFTNLLFEQFTWWLTKRKGIEYSSCFIQKYFIFFYKIDLLANILNKFPTYLDLLKHFKVSFTRKYLLVMIFLNEHNVIEINEKTKELYSNLNIIASYLNYFNKNSSDYLIIHSYYEYLEQKYLSNKTTKRSIRLALTPAIKLLEYKNNFNISKLSDNIIHGYLWIYPGQKNSLTGFINYLNKRFNYSLSSIKNLTYILESSTSRKKQLQLRLIYLLKKEKLTILQQKRLINISLEYFHRIKISTNVCLSIKNIFKINNIYYICCCKNKFYLPNNIYFNLKYCF
ncbi:hypothetical protein HUX57_00010 [Arcobacter butzleri]|uniref:hypothetical protein n=1 Tax=Aliarcobacter butzleri TaxID=28197 RepID=UPI0015873EEA|nr:hypothetical protein [Aliarcobacter butzleri]NUW25060.1 hypothetical protein [Aliarcobacter butzleri]